MNRLIISLFIFIFSLAFSVSYAAGTDGNSIADLNTVSPGSSVAAQTAYTTETELIAVRVLIEGRWWTYYYALDGSFIVAIPDEDE